MPSPRFFARGTVLNAGTVAGGGLIGLAVGSNLDPAYQVVAMGALGLIVMLIGVKMFLQTRNPLIVIAAMVGGGMLGVALGIAPAIDRFAAWAQTALGGQGRFQEALVFCSVLYCVGPMTLLGCVEDALENKIDVLAVKSMLDGIASIFFAASFGVGGWGVVASAGVILAFQGLLTLLAKPLKPLVSDEARIAEVTAVGGVFVLAIGLSLLELKRLPTASFLPAVFLATPILVLSERVASRFSGKRISEPPDQTSTKEA